MALRDENRCLASEASAYSHYRKGQQERKQRVPKAGDLVLVRNHAVDGQRGRKLEGKWLGPRLLVSLSSSGLTGRVRELYEEGSTKKYHVNDLILYVERKDFEICGIKVLQPDMETTPAVIGGHGGGESRSQSSHSTIEMSEKRGGTSGKKRGVETDEKWMTAGIITSIN